MVSTRAGGGARAFGRVLFGLGALVLGWQLAILALDPPAYMLPPPGEVLRAFAARPDYFLRHAGITLIEVLLGLCAGASAGVVMAVAIAALPRAGRALWPFLLAAQALPVFAIAPLLVLWFGFGLSSKVVMAGLIIFFPVTSAFVDGMRRVDPAILDDCAMTEASHWQALWHVRLPLGLPGLVSGLRVAAPLAPLGAVVGEWVGASGGLGFIMLQANARMKTAEVFAALVLLAAMTLALRALVDLITPKLVPWARETPG